MLIGPKHGTKWWIKFLPKRKWLFEVNLNDTRGLFRTLSNIYYEAWRSSQPELFLGKVALKTCNKFTGEHLCRSVNSIKLLCNLLHSLFGMAVLLLICCIYSEHLFLRTPLDGCFWTFCKNSERLLEVNYFSQKFHHRCLAAS